MIKHITRASALFVALLGTNCTPCVQDYNACVAWAQNNIPDPRSQGLALDSCARAYADCRGADAGPVELDAGSDEADADIEDVGTSTIVDLDAGTSTDADAGTSSLADVGFTTDCRRTYARCTDWAEASPSPSETMVRYGLCQQALNSCEMTGVWTFTF